MAARGVKVGNAFIEVHYDVDVGTAAAKIASLKNIANKLDDFKVNINTDTTRFENTLMGSLSKVGNDINTRSSAWGQTMARNMTAHISDIDRDVDVHSNRWGASILRGITSVSERASAGLGNMFRNVFKNDSLQRGFEGAISLLPGRMESLFVGKAGPIGLAMGVALVGGIAVAMPALGAMVSGAIFAGLVRVW